MAEEQQDGQKAIVAFIVGLLIGGMLVWAFSGPDADAPTSDVEKDVIEAGVSDGNEKSDEEESVEDSIKTGSVDISTKTLNVGKGDVRVLDQKASKSVVLDSATYPVSEGWIGVREYTDDNLGYILGVVRFSESEGVIPSEIVLQRSTTAGRKYAVVIYTEDGDFEFSLSGDVQIDTVFDTFTAE